jgi:excisionase family DNA binding protein
MNARPADQPIAYSLEQVADRTPWSVRTLRRLCADGRIDHVKVGRKYALTPDQLNLLLTQHAHTARRPATPDEIAAADLAEARHANRRRAA